MEYFDDDCDRRFNEEGDYTISLRGTATYLPEPLLKIRSEASIEIEVREKRILWDLRLRDSWEQRFISGTQLSMHFFPMYDGLDFVILDDKGENQHPVDCENEGDPGGIFYRALSKNAASQLCTTQRKMIDCFYNEIDPL
ncbi:hypothetical protein [Roseibium sp. RKSG952]|uniref:hypothetical protein n=1 Tax=Roseibium sp. RKSG952 TaxID=2529384 RepID=UPI0012BB8A1B|nr:hypothetical protein [Roseibium sp. RKSG952]MTH94808.1 hypothetical protein [Roseibium sp. RKSG952]